MEISTQEYNLHRTIMNQILETSTEFYDNPNGPYEESCPFCDASQRYKGNEPTPSMDELNHDSDCTWILANMIEYPEKFL